MSRSTYFGFICLIYTVGPLVNTQEPLTRCPDGYITHRNSCYKFHHVQLTWPEAGYFCKMLDAHLVTLETQEEYKYIELKANEIASSLTADGVWIGLTDAVNQGEWIWIHTNDQISYDVWGPGEPQNRSGEDCAAMAKSEGYKIADYMCRTLNHLVCEIDLEVDIETIVG